MLNKIVNKLAETGRIPDSLLRLGIRRLLRVRLQQINSSSSATASSRFIADMNASPIAAVPEKANEQHYELPPEFFLSSLGEQLKYSCSYWQDGCNDLDQAEIAALEKTCQHAGLVDGLDILELGCGWGSLSLHMAKHYPSSSITAVSNSKPQAEFIRAKAQSMAISNLVVITADMNEFETEKIFDRVVSVEMFEHMRNWQQLFQNVTTWLKPDGAFFMHIFVHQTTPYFYEDKADSDWMTRFFFSGGIMPSLELPLQFEQQLTLSERWIWPGQHYQKTANAWLAKMDQNEPLIKPLFERCYGKAHANTWWMRWRLFYMACAELFGYNDGKEWFVAHYLFHRTNLAQ